MPVAGRDLIYRVDAEDLLCHVDAVWEAFAAANGGEDLGARQVLGRSLWAFVCDPSMSQLYRHLMAEARRGGQVRLRFRCDAPTERRLLEMHVTGLADGAVEFRTRPIVLAFRPHEALLDVHGARTGMPLPVCSWCNRVWVGDGWVEVEIAVERLHLMLRTVLPPLAHVTCDDCRSTIRRQVGRYFATAPVPVPATPPLILSLGDDPFVLGAA